MLRFRALVQRRSLHLDEVPDGMTHALLLRDGLVVGSGPIGLTLTSQTLSDCFEMPLTLERRDDGRMTAWARRVRPVVR